MSVKIFEATRPDAIVQGRRMIVERIFGVKLAGCEKLRLVHIRVIIGRDWELLRNREINDQRLQQKESGQRQSSCHPGLEGLSDEPFSVITLISTSGMALCGRTEL